MFPFVNFVFFNLIWKSLKKKNIFWTYLYCVCHTKVEKGSTHRVVLEICNLYILTANNLFYNFEILFCFDDYILRCFVWSGKEITELYFEPKKKKTELYIIRLVHHWYATFCIFSSFIFIQLYYIAILLLFYSMTRIVYFSVWKHKAVS